MPVSASRSVPHHWRLIPPLAASGAAHMAIDSWLLDQHVKGLQPSTLRFYTWAQPTLSLGYHQKQFPVHWNNLHYKGQRIDLVRRPTGGRAVLHQGDLTYAIVTSGLQGARREVYQRLCQFLLEGWGDLGVTLRFGAAGRGYIKNPNCFGTATAADLVMVDGFKLIGSAQVYREGAVLQHGSMRLQPDSELFELIFAEKIAPPTLPEKGMAKIMGALTAAASRCFAADFATQILSPDDIAKAIRNNQRLS